MIKLSVIGSSSSGNGYILQDENEAIVIECGCPFSDCERYIDFNIGKIRAALLTHEHGDHARYVNQYLEYGVKVVATAGTLNAVMSERKRNIIAIEPWKRLNLGGFSVMAFPTEHDAAEPCGYAIQCPDGNKVVFATDTRALPYRFVGMNYYMIECNYDDNILRRNIRTKEINLKVAERVRRSHLSLSECEKVLSTNDLTEVNGVILLHLSSNNGNEVLFTERIQRCTGKMVYVAKKGLSISFIN